MNYFDRPELSHSKLKRIDRGYEYFKKDFIGSPAMREGTVLHEHILEDIEFEESSYKTFCKSLENNQIPLGYAEKLSHYKERVLNHPESDKLKGKVETELYGQREGFDIKGKVDVIGDGFLTDFKTTNSIDRWIKNGFINEWTILNFSYHTQLEYYKYLAELNGHKINNVYLFVLTLEESEVFCLDLTEWLESAKNKNTERFNKLVEYQFNETQKEPNYMFNKNVILDTPFTN